MKKSNGINKKNIAVFISGRGSNLKSLIKYSKLKKSRFNVKLVITNKKNAKGLNYAKKNKIVYFIVNYKNKKKAEKKIFLDSPRHPRWKSELITKAKEGVEGALHILLDKAKVTEKQLSKITIGAWRKVQDIVLSNEGTLVSECGRLLGRLDLLISDLDSGASGGWIVADLKTGKYPLW